MGSGKTTVLGEASDLLTQAGVIHAALDLDAIGGGHLPDGVGDDLSVQNLAVISRHFAAAGVTRLLIAEALDSASKRDRLRAATGATSLVVCRLRASFATMQERVRLREPGMLQEQFVARVVELDRDIDRAEVADFAVDNERRSVTDVAREVLHRAGWPLTA